jgi:hypothetical protein
VNANAERRRNESSGIYQTDESNKRFSNGEMWITLPSNEKISHQTKHDLPVTVVKSIRRPRQGVGGLNYIVNALNPK